MASLRRVCIALVVALVVAASPAAAAKGKLGFQAKITISGFFHRTLKTVTVLAIAPDSPASAAGLAPGDRILKVNGEPIEGVPARKMSALVNDAKPGQHLKFAVMRGDELLVMDLVVVP